MKSPRSRIALCLALRSALPFAGCTEYCAVKVKRPHGPTDTANGKIVAEALRRNWLHPEIALASCLDSAAAVERQLRNKPGDVKAGRLDFLVREADDAASGGTLREGPPGM